MLRKSYGFLLFLSLFILSACSSKSIKPAALVSATDDQAVLHVYRPSTVSNSLISPYLFLDAKKIIKLSNAACFTMYLPLGKHSVSLALPDRYQGMHFIDIEIQKKKSVFLRVDSFVKFKMNDRYSRGFDIKEVDAMMAINEINDCHVLLKNSGDDLINSNDSLPIEPTPVFSRSKTKNPFNKSN